MSDGGMDNSLRKGTVYDKFGQFSSPFNTFFFSLCSFPLLLNFMAMPSPYRFFRCSLRLVPLAELEEVVW